MLSLSALNQTIFLFIHNFSGQNVVLDGVAIFFAQYLQYALVLGFLLLIAYQTNARRQMYLFAVAAMAIILSRGIITTAIHFWYDQLRPFEFYGFSPLIEQYGASFPSGHAAWFFALATVVWCVNRRWGTAYLILAALMGVARVYAGIHWPLDVIVGAVIGIASGAFVPWLLRKDMVARAAAATTSVPPSKPSRA